MGWDWVEIEWNASSNGYLLKEWGTGTYLHPRNVSYESKPLNGNYPVTVYLKGQSRPRKADLQFTKGSTTTSSQAGGVKLNGEGGITKDDIEKAGVSIKT